MKLTDAMQRKRFMHWNGMEDGVCTGKWISKYRVELFYGTNRGGEILIWEPGYEKLEHIWPPSDDKKYHLMDSVNYMNWKAAKADYGELKRVSDITDLMTRNS